MWRFIQLLKKLMLSIKLAQPNQFALSKQIRYLQHRSDYSRYDCAQIQRRSLWQWLPPNQQKLTIEES
jgi:hypothetical protein